MERSRKIFLEISSASHKVTLAANVYADHKGFPGVQRSHFQLEADMRRISIACNTLAAILSKQPLSDDATFDVRLQDWLSSDEPRLCLDTLSKMEKLLQVQKETSTWKTILEFLTGQGTTFTQDKIKEAADLLGSCNGCFHFLFTTETWNNEGGARQQNDIPRSQGYIPEGAGIFDQSSLVAVPMSTDTTTMEDTAIFESTRAVTRKKHERTVDMERKKEEDARNFEEILAWLDGLNCTEKQDVTFLLRQPDTCRWLFDTTQYKMWRNGECPCLWLCGKPGAGKSVLASSVIDSLEKIRREGEILAFFYCDFRNECSTSASEALRSILSQLLHQLRESTVDPGNLIDDLVDAKKRGGATRNSIKELARFASRTARLFMKKPLVVVDALDECKDVETLLGGLDALKGSVQLFLTSRPLQVIKDGLSSNPFILIDEMVENLSADISLHVTRELDARRRLRVLTPAIKTEIHSVLCHKADGMFRWVQCSIDTLNRCVTLKELSKALCTLPEGLDETYERTLLGIDTETREGQLALRALVWLVAALRPLQIDELMEGLSIDLEKRELDISIGPMHRQALMDACGSLVTYNEKTDMIVLSHFSVKEYLTSEFAHNKLPRYHINWEHAHLQLARSCMCYVSVFLKRSRVPDGSSSSEFSNQHNISSHFMSHPLLRYVIKDALDHFRHIQVASVLHDVKALAKDIERNSQIWDKMCFYTLRIARPTTPIWPLSSHDLPLYILVAFFPDLLLRAYLPRPIFKPKSGTNPLIYAAYFNKLEHARTLLSHGIKLNCRGWDIDRSSLALPIEVAMRNGHHPMVNFFVAEGSVTSPRIFTKLLALHYGNVPSSIKRMLLQTDDFVEAVNGVFDDPRLKSFDSFRDFLIQGIHEQDLIFIVRRMIQAVPGRGHSSVPQFFDTLLDTAVTHFREDDALETIKLLVGHGYDPLQVRLNSFGRPPLYTAVERAHISVTQYLISIGIQLPPNMLVTALEFWSSREWVLTTPTIVKAPMVRFLVQNGAHVHARTDAGDCVLHVALRISSDEDDALEVAKLLVGCGCDPLEADSSGKSALYIAIEQAHISVARYLLSLGALLPPDILVRLDPQGIWRTAQIIRFLVENGASVHAHTRTGDSMFRIASDSCQCEDEMLELAKFLVHYGSDPLEVDSSGKSILCNAIEQTHISVAQYLLSLSVPLPPDILVRLNPQGIWWTAQIVRFLVEHGANVHARTRTGDSVFHTAAGSLQPEYEALELAKLLVAYGCDPLEVNSAGKSSLDIAIEQTHVSVAQYLLSLGASLPPDILVKLNPRGMWRTARTIRFLVAHGADVRVRTRTGDSMLHIALDSFQPEDEALELAKLLVGYGCDPLEVNSAGKSSLHIAIEQAHIYVVQYLLSLSASLPPDILVKLNPQGIWRTARTVRFLVVHGADVHARTETGDSMFHIALDSFQPEDEALELAELLITYGCDPLEVNSYGKIPLHIAIEQGHISVVQYLFSLGNPLPPDLLLVALNSQQSIVGAKNSMIQFLIQEGADVHVRAETGDSVFHIVMESFSENNVLGMAEILVDRGCDPLEVNSLGRTPLHIAVERGYTSVVQYLLSLGVLVPPNILVMLSQRGDWLTVEMISFLVENGADIYARDDVGDSVLHVVLESLVQGLHEAREVVELLLAYGCDPFAVNAHGKTSLQVAVERGLYSVENYLESLGVPWYDLDVGPFAIDQE